MNNERHEVFVRWGGQAETKLPKPAPLILLKNYGDKMYRGANGSNENDANGGNIGTVELGPSLRA
jgi:hypothetical protein